jgi:hypothetical protein
MTTLWDRPYGPTTGAAQSALMPALNAQANQLPVLPVTQSVITTAETVILNPLNAGSALTAIMDPNTSNEQTLIDIVASGYIKTTASGNIILGLYYGSSATVVSGNLLHKTASATTQNSTTAPFFLHGQVVYDSLSGKLQGKCGMEINNVIDPEIALTNVITGINNAAATAAGVLGFSLTITSSGAGSGTPTTINVQKFTAG